MGGTIIDPTKTYEEKIAKVAQAALEARQHWWMNFYKNCLMLLGIVIFLILVCYIGYTGATRYVMPLASTKIPELKSKIVSVLATPTPLPTATPAFDTTNIRAKVIEAIQASSETKIINLDFSESHTSCDAVISFADYFISTSDDQPMVIGKRYCIADTSQGAFQSAMTVESNLNDLADLILSSSGVAQDDPVTPSPTLPSPTSTPEPTAEATPPLPTARPTTDTQHLKRNIDELIQLMKVQNVFQVMSGDMTQDFRDGKTTLINLYFTNGEMLEYYVLDTKEMSLECSLAKQKIIVSQNPFDQAVQYGEAWVYCK